MVTVTGLVGQVVVEVTNPPAPPPPPYLPPDPPPATTTYSIESEDPEVFAKVPVEVNV